MVKPIHRFVFVQTLRSAPLSSAESPRQLLGECLVLAQLVQDRFMGQIGDVFCVVEGSRCGGALVGLFLVAGFSREDP
jgi:hypothetical protein